jgi:hypothetical protein
VTVNGFVLYQNQPPAKGVEEGEMVIISPVGDDSTPPDVANPLEADTTHPTPEPTKPDLIYKGAKAPTFVPTSDPETIQ